MDDGEAHATRGGLTVPLPEPNDGESESDFVSRCMGSEAAQEFEDQEQRAGVCYSQYRKGKGGKDGAKASAKTGAKTHHMDIEADVEWFDIEGTNTE